MRRLVTLAPAVAGIVLAAAWIAPVPAGAQDVEARKPTVRNADAPEVGAGERLFRTRCGGCHSVQEGQNRVGPSLFRVVGRPSGSLAGVRYSPALRELGIVWDADQLNRFLTNPRAMVTGTAMSVSIPNEGERTSIIAYLQSASP